ncbi:MAG: hypothetical protein ACPGRX_04865 [Bdellovibrionales bacterium]
MANQFLSLALFVMLLAFFIVLTSMSNFEPSKSEPVLNSVLLAFQTDGQEKDLQPNVTESTRDLSSREGSTLEKIEGLFSSRITGVETQTNRLGTIMHLRMKVERFEKTIMGPEGVTGGVGSAFMPTLVSLLQSRDAGVPYRMDMVLNTRQKPAQAVSDAPEDLNADVKKVARYSKRLEDQGLPKKMLSVGLSEGDPEFLDIYIRRYEPFILSGNAAAAPQEAAPQESSSQEAAP